MPNFRGGRPSHAKFYIPIPEIRNMTTILVQLMAVHKEFGDDGARDFVAETERLSECQPGELAHLLHMVGVKP